MRRVPSFDPETMRLPSGEKPTAETLSSCPLRVMRPSPVRASQMRRVLSPDPETMRLLAHKTGGLALDLANLARLADEFPGGEERREPISSRLEDAWDTWMTLLTALGLLSAEWILRKRGELV